MKELTQEELGEYWECALSQDPYEDIEDLGVTDKWRWGTIQAKILRHKESGKYYKLTAHYQPEEGIQGDIQVTEVCPKEKTTIDWISVKE